MAGLSSARTVTPVLPEINLQSASCHTERETGGFAPFWRVDGRADPFWLLPHSPHASIDVQRIYIDERSHGNLFRIGVSDSP